MELSIHDTKLIARAAVFMAISADKQEEQQLKEKLAGEGIHATVVEFGGEFISSAGKIIERAVTVAKREGLIGSEYHLEGAVAGAAREALSAVSAKAIGLNVGGKIGIARDSSNLAVCIFFGIGMLHLDDIAIGLGHRAI
ncbi:MAG: HutP family protein [Christensenellales bacterium]|jgi:hypothetical protein